jgi:hypothetical protein
MCRRLAAFKHEAHIDVAVDCAETAVRQATEFVTFHERFTEFKFEVLGDA